MGAVASNGMLPASPVQPSVTGMMSPQLNAGAGSHGHSITELVPPSTHPSTAAISSPPSPHSTNTGLTAANMVGQAVAGSMSAAAALSAAAAAASVSQSNNQGW